MSLSQISPGIVPLVGAEPASGSRSVPLFDKILVANRGEIACRIIATARRMGIRSVAVYSEADRNAQHVALADESVCVGPESAQASYLDIARLVDACRLTGVQAVHPGYGFLSENAAFARAVVEAGMAFIGPTPGAIASMGDKLAAKNLAVDAGVNVIPGRITPIQTEEEAHEAADAVGYPVIVKAVAGGGGRGLRIVRDRLGLAEAIRSCRSEARAGFGDDRVFIERAIGDARHVEVQVLADAYGNCVHLWERECSIQRRHQKLLEESPSPFLDEATRARLCAQAVVLAKAAGYRSAGTVEFLVGPDQAFYFIEMNTRLQVEHPVTECLTGIDLVEQMIRIAAGEPLSFDQSQVPRRGWAMECRINAEDPQRGFLPSGGRLSVYRPPEVSLWPGVEGSPGGGVRVDSGVREGDVITTHYDSLIAKLIVHAPDREACVRRMRESLNCFVVRGVASNVAFHSALTADLDFQAGRVHTGFLAARFAGGDSVQAKNGADYDFLVALAAAVHVRDVQRDARIQGRMTMPRNSDGDYVVVVTGCSGEPSRRIPVSVRGRDEATEVVLAGRVHRIQLQGSTRDLVLRGVASLPFAVQCDRRGLSSVFSFNGLSIDARVMPRRVAELEAVMPARRAREKAKALHSPMAGRLQQIATVPGQRVRSGEKLAIVEAMKMENTLLAEEDCIVAELVASEGDNVVADQVIMRFR